MTGIHHAHFAGGFEVRYATTDLAQQTIPWVERRNLLTGETKTYRADGTCGASHQLLAVEESLPDILKTLGLWDHIEALKAHALVR